MYKYKIGIRPSDAFGVEIEFEGTELEKLCNCCDVPIEYSLCHKAYAPKYNNWYLDLDLTVTKEKNGKFFGGEFTSRILRDDVKSWGELENICSLLINNNALSTPNCSTHITLDVSDYLKTPEDFKIFCEVMSVYEIDMNLFYMGDKFLIRNNKEKYARSIGWQLGEVINKIDFSRDDYFKQIVKESGCFIRKDGISLHKLYYGLMEVRYPNGTFIKETIQNFISFTYNLLEAIKNKKFNQEYLEYVIKYEHNYFSERLKYLYYQEDEEKFCELIDIIGGDYKDEYYNQYQKVLSTR